MYRLNIPKNDMGNNSGRANPNVKLTKIIVRRKEYFMWITTSGPE